MDDPAVPVVAPEDAHHLERVLRLRAGQEVVVADGRGLWALAAWTGGRAGREELLEPIGRVHHEDPAVPPLTVAFAPVKGERPEWAVQKLTELGIDRIVPLRTRHAVVRWSGSRGEASVARLRRVARRGGRPEPPGLAARGPRDPRLRRSRAARRAGPGRPGAARGSVPHTGPPGGGRGARGWVEHRRARVRPARGRSGARRPAGRDRRGHGGGAPGRPARRVGRACGPGTGTFTGVRQRRQKGGEPRE